MQYHSVQTKQVTINSVRNTGASIGRSGWTKRPISSCLLRVMRQVALDISHRPAGGRPDRDRKNSTWRSSPLWKAGGSTRGGYVERRLGHDHGWRCAPNIVIWSSEPHQSCVCVYAVPSTFLVLTRRPSACFTAGTKTETYFRNVCHKLSCPSHDTDIKMSQRRSLPMTYITTTKATSDMNTLP